jgi:Family of unknown function (DUF6130)
MAPAFRHSMVALAAAALCVAAWSQPAPDAGRPAAVIPLESEPAAKLFVYPPLAGPLARGVVIVQYRTENLRVIPVFGMGAAEVSPRVGHLHVTIDDRPGTWAHTSGDPIIVVGLTPGVHKMLIELADPNHKIIASQTISATVPEVGSSGPHAHKP